MMIDMLITDCHKGVFSFGTAIGPRPQNPSFWFKWRDSEQKPLPILTHIHRGWDHTNLQWQHVLWPDLDCHLQPQGQSGVWRLHWQDRKTKNTSTEHPQAQGSSNNICRESNILGEEQTEDGLTVKEDKGKGKEVAKDKMDGDIS